jgi:hypothetical protein
MLGSQLFTQHNFKGDLKVKLIVLEKKQENRVGGLKQFFSPIMNIFQSSSITEEEDEYHIGLLIGPRLFQYDSSGLCVPKKFITHNEIALCADLDNSLSIKDAEGIIPKIAEVCAHWNVKKQFRHISVRKDIFGNSHDFVTDMLQAIGVKFNCTPQMRTFLDNVSKNGTSKLEFCMDNDFKKKFGAVQDAIVVKTHSDLDVFVKDLLKTDPKFEIHYPGEYSLLKSFDRTLWMKYFTLCSKHNQLKDIQNDVEILKLKEEIKKNMAHSESCPFKAPTLTGSFLGIRSRDRNISRLHKNSMLPIRKGSLMIKKVEEFSDSDELDVKIIGLCELSRKDFDFRAISDQNKILICKGFNETKQRLESTFDTIEIPFDRSYDGYIPHPNAIFRVLHVSMNFSHYLRENIYHLTLFEFLVDVKLLNFEIKEREITNFFLIVNQYIRVDAPKWILKEDAVFVDTFLTRIKECNCNQWNLKESPRALLDEIVVKYLPILEEEWKKWIKTDEGFKTLALQKNNPMVISITEERLVVGKVVKTFEGDLDELTELASCLMKPEKIALLYFTNAWVDKYVSFKVVLLSHMVISQLRPIPSLQHFKRIGQDYEGERLGLVVGGLVFVIENNLCIPYLIPLHFDCLYSLDLSQFMASPKVTEKIKLQFCQVVAKWNLCSYEIDPLEWINTLLIGLETHSLESLHEWTDIMSLIRLGKLPLLSLGDYHPFRYNLGRSYCNQLMLIGQVPVDIGLDKIYWIIDILHGRDFNCKDVSLKIECASVEGKVTTKYTSRGEPIWNQRIVFETVDEIKDVTITLFQKKILGKITFDKKHKQEFNESWYSLTNHDGEVLIKSFLLQTLTGKKRLLREYANIEFYNMDFLLNQTTGEDFIDMLTCESVSIKPRERFALMSFLLSNPKGDHVKLIKQVVLDAFEDTSDKNPFLIQSNCNAKVLETIFEIYSHSHNFNHLISIVGTIQSHGKEIILSKMTNKEISFVSDLVVEWIKHVQDSLNSLPPELNVLLSIILEQCQIKQVSKSIVFGYLLFCKPLDSEGSIVQSLTHREWIVQTLSILRNIMMVVVHDGLFDSSLKPFKTVIEGQVVSTRKLLESFHVSHDKMELTPYILKKEDQLWMYHVLHVFFVGNVSSLLRMGESFMMFERIQSEIDRRRIWIRSLQKFVTQLGKPPIVDFDPTKILSISLALKHLETQRFILRELSEISM